MATRPTLRGRPARPLVALIAALVHAAPASAQSCPLLHQETDGTLTLCSVDVASGQALPVAWGVDILPLKQAGAARRDRLRTDMPRPGGEDGPTPHVLLPLGGALYRLRTPDGAALLHVAPDGTAHVVAPVVGAAGSVPIQPSVCVAPDGGSVWLATTSTAGGDVLHVDLAAGGVVTSLTTDIDPLEIDSDSLRGSAVGAFWVADGTLWRAPAGAAAEPVDDTALGGLPVVPDLALCVYGHRVAGVAGSEEAEEFDRQVFVAGFDGDLIVATDEPADYEAPRADDALGPFLALSEDGTLVAFRRTMATQELLVKQVDLPLPALQLTVEPSFPDYIDNVGVLGFAAGNLLHFFAGDATVSGVDLQEMMGAADLYFADIATDGSVTFTNVSHTGGQSAPPYDQSGTLQFAEAVLDPMAQRYLLFGEEEDGAQSLTAVNLVLSAYGDATTALLASLEEDPQLATAGVETLIIAPVTAGDVEDDDDAGVALYRLPLLHVGTELVPLAELPPPLVTDRFVITRDGTFLACVVSVAPGLELVVRGTLLDGLLLPTLFIPLGVSAQLAFASDGSLLAGFGAAGGPFKFAAFAKDLSITAVKLPAGWGFPLAH